MDSHLKSRIEKLSYRETNFILYGLKHDQPRIVVPGDNKYLLYLLNNEPYKNSNIVQNICDLIYGKIVNDEFFRWVKNDLRASIWLYQFYASNYVKYQLPITQHLCMNDFLNNLIFNFDIASFRSQEAYSNQQQQQRMDPPIDTLKQHHIHILQNQPLQHFQYPVFGENGTFMGLRSPSQYPPPPPPPPPSQYPPLPLPLPLPLQPSSSFFEYNFAVQEKIKFLNQAKSIYTQRITPRSDTKWINKNDEDQIYWAVEYLKSHSALITPPLFLASNIDDIYNQICASLDSIDSSLPFSAQPYQVSTNKYLFISRMRKAWSQKKFRDRKDVDAAQDMLLPRATKKQLKELSEAYGANTVDVLCSIIDSAYKDTTF